tara:strand:- start:129 stop:365 length:237 start_codon:yes stop_codon:yes gene_type:complete
MHLDDSILQSKTATTLIEVLKEARTITKSNTNACKNINEKIEHCVKAHDKAINIVRCGKRPDYINGKSSFHGIYKVNL